MKELLASIFENAKNRVKNPYIGSVALSVIFLNWRAVLVLMFSEKNIEERIKFVENNYYDIWFILYIPLIVALVFIAGIPYLNLLVDFVSKSAFLNRSDISTDKEVRRIQNQTKVSLEEFKREEAKTNFKERNELNKTLEIYKQTISSLESELMEEKTRFAQVSEEFRQDSRKKDDLFSEEALSYQKRITELQEELSKMNANALQKDRELSFFSEELKARELEMQSLQRKNLKESNSSILNVEKLMKDIKEKESQIERLNRVVNSFELLRIDNDEIRLSHGVRIKRDMSFGSDSKYFRNIATGEILSEDQAKDLVRQYGFSL